MTHAQKAADFNAPIITAAAAPLFERMAISACESSWAGLFSVSTPMAF